MSQVNRLKEHNKISGPNQIKGRMQLFVGALMVGAILMVNFMSSVDASESLLEYCWYLNQTMGRSSENFENPPATYELAHSLIHGAGIIQSDRALLAEAWRVVTYKEDCNSKSHEFISAIYDCRPGRFQSMKDTLEKDAREYVRKCFPDPSKFDEVLQTEFKALISDDSTGLIRFLDQKFMATYRRKDPDDKHLTVLNFMCGWPRDSDKNIVDSIIRLPENKDKDVASYYLQKPGELTSVLNKHLFEPCVNYVKQVRPLMKTMKMLEDMSYQEKGTWILEGHSQDLKDVILRYKYCQLMERPPVRQGLERFVLELLSEGYKTSEES